MIQYTVCFLIIIVGLIINVFISVFLQFHLFSVSNFICLPTATASKSICDEKWTCNEIGNATFSHKPAIKTLWFLETKWSASEITFLNLLKLQTIKLEQLRNHSSNDNAVDKFNSKLFRFYWKWNKGYTYILHLDTIVMVTNYLTHALVSVIKEETWIHVYK